MFFHESRRIMLKVAICIGLWSLVSVESRYRRYSSSSDLSWELWVIIFVVLCALSVCFKLCMNGCGSPTTSSTVVVQTRPAPVQQMQTVVVPQLQPVCVPTNQMNQHQVQPITVQPMSEQSGELPPQYEAAAAAPMQVYQ